MNPMQRCPSYTDSNAALAEEALEFLLLLLRAAASCANFFIVIDLFAGPPRPAFFRDELCGGRHFSQSDGSDRGRLALDGEAGRPLQLGKEFCLAVVANLRRP
jgi:hypothetical protein